MKKIAILFTFFFCCIQIVNGQQKKFNIEAEMQKCQEAYYHTELDKAIQIAEQALQYMDINNVTNNNAHAVFLNRTALCYLAKGFYDEALRNAQKALEYIKSDSNGIDIVEHVLSSQTMSQNYLRIGDYSNAITINNELARTLEENDRSKLGESYSRIYLATLYQLAYLFLTNGELDSADSNLQKAYNYINGDSFVCSALNVECVSSIADLLYRTNVSSARQLDQHVLNYTKDLLQYSSLKNIIVYNPTSPFLLALPISSYVRLGEIDKALEYARMLHKEVNEFCKYLKNNVGVGDYINASYLYTHCFSLFSDYGYLGEAFSVLQSMYTSCTFLENVGKETDVFRERILNFQLLYLDYTSLYLKSMGNYRSALNHDTIALNYTIGLSNYQPTAQVANRLYTVAHTYKRLNSLDTCCTYLYLAADFYEKALGTSSPAYITTSTECLYEYFQHGFFLNTANELIDSCMKEINTVDIRTDNRYDWALLNIAKCHIILSQYDTAYKYLKLIGNRDESTVVDNIAIMEAELDCLVRMGLHNQASSVLNKLFDARKTQITQGFSVMPGNYRARLWNEVGYSFLKTIPVTSYIIESDSSIICATNATLLSKGILLNTEQSLRQTIFNSKDSAAITWYDSISFYMGMLKMLEKDSLSHTKYTPDYLKIEILKAEQQLSNRVKAYGDITHDIAINWKSVQKFLKSKEAAIEFNTFTTEKDSTITVAYITRPTWAVPKQVIIAELAKGESLTKGDTYSNTRLSKKIWQTLSPVLEGVKTIYFSPAGELYNIAIESLPDYEDSTRLISDRYNLYRLSSTRELAKGKRKIPIKNGSVYGGLRYDAEIDTTLRGADGNRSFTYFPWTADSTTIGTRENLPTYLPNTLTEAQYIGEMMSHTSIKPHVYTGGDGDEASFKRLSGSNANLLHIATHGFYYEGTQELKQNRESVVGEDKSMTRSGLLFAGVNNTYKNPSASSNTYNDGILTAQEIAQLDLKNVDMAVLSACETGLGELKGDGVFGLQRGFKKAGVNSIIMSLWKVDDLATQMLMTRFYENWLIKKMPKQKALKEAQAYVRNYEVDELEWAIELRKQKNQRGGGGNFRTHATGKIKTNKTSSDRTIKPFQDPRYWAAFILLDGLD